MDVFLHPRLPGHGQVYPPVCQHAPRHMRTGGRDAYAHMDTCRHALCPGQPSPLPEVRPGLGSSPDTAQGLARILISA